MYKKAIDMTFRSVFDNYLVLIKALIIYTALIITIDYINMNNIIVLDGKEQVRNGFLSFITIVTSYIIYLMVAVSSHRVFILGENSIPPWGLFKLTKREWSFFINAVMIGIIATIAMIPSLAISIPLGKQNSFIAIIILLTASLIIISRFSLVFPAISIDKEITIADAWNFTKKYKLLVFTTIILFPLIFSATFGFVYGIAIKFIANIINFKLIFLYSILNIFITVFTISALSATYKLISEEHPEYFTPLKDNKEPRKTIVFDNEKNHKIIIHDKNNITFEELKEKLKSQYFNLGFSEIVVDKGTSWMIKNPQYNESYVLLSHKDDEYIIEIFQSEMVDFLDELEFINT